MHAILIEHKTSDWHMMYNPGLSLKWLEAFLQGGEKLLDPADYRLHAIPGDGLVAAERGEAVVHRLEQSLWPWQSTRKIINKHIDALERLDLYRISYATPWLVALKIGETSIKRDYVLLRDFIGGQPVADYFNQHTNLTPELISLASEICLLIARLAKLGFNVAELRAADLVYINNSVEIANWWRLLPMTDARETITELSLIHFFRAWQERVDIHNLFMESFKRIDIKAIYQRD